MAMITMSANAVIRQIREVARPKYEAVVADVEAVLSAATAGDLSIMESNLAAAKGDLYCVDRIYLMADLANVYNVPVLLDEGDYTLLWG